MYQQIPKADPRIPTRLGKGKSLKMQRSFSLSEIHLPAEIELSKVNSYPLLNSSGILIDNDILNPTKLKEQLS